MPPAARVGDLHTCPAHVGGPLTDGSATVNIGGQPAARVGDHASCHGSSDTISQGSSTVFIENRPAARSGDRSAHAGVIVTGFDTVVIGNDGSATGGAASGTGPDDPKVPSVSGTPVSTQVLNSFMALAQQFGGGLDSPFQTAITSTTTALEVALARQDLGALVALTAQLQSIVQQAHAKKSADKDGDAAAAAATSPSGARGWQTDGTIPGEAPRSVVVRDGRLAVNDQFVGLHAISEFDLIELQAGGRIETIVQRLVAASAAGRNCARIFCMYRNARGSLIPKYVDGYWDVVDALIRRLAAYGMFGEFVLLADCERRADGSGGAMPSWDDRRAFVREAGAFFKGKTVLVSGMNEPFRNGAAGPDDPRLVEVMRLFAETSGGTVPFSVGDPRLTTVQDVAAAPGIEAALARSGASILVLHGRRQQPDDRRYRWWIDRLTDLSDLRLQPLAGAPLLYHSEPMGFGGRREEDRRDNDPEAAVVAACASAILQLGFCYHHVAIEDPATPGLELTRVATLIPQSPDFVPRAPGAEAGPIASFTADDFPGGSLVACSNGREAWALGYGKRIAKEPRIEWRGAAPEVVWRGEHGILWRAAATRQA